MIPEEQEQKRKDDKFMRGLVVSSFLSAVLGVGGWLYTVIIVQSDVNYLKAEQMRTAQYFEFIIEVKTQLNTLVPLVRDTNVKVNSFGSEQSRRGPIVNRSERHMDNDKIHKR